MPRTTTTHRQDRAARSTRPAQHRGTRATVAVGVPLLIMAAAAGCTARPSVQSEAQGSSSVEAVPVLGDLPSGTDVPPGRYVVLPADAPASIPQVPVLTIPEGYVSIGGDGVTPDLPGLSGDSAVWLWDVTSVYTHPCDADGSAAPVGPTVDDLARALAAQPMRAGTDPVAVTVGGYDGLYVELSTPDDLDFTTCREGYFHTWPGRSQRDAGQKDLLWIVDVEGQRITFDVSYPPDMPPEAVEELRQIVTTTTFAPGDAAPGTTPER